MAETKLMPSAFETVKSEMENYVGIESVERTEYDDIINVNLSGNVYRPANYENVLEMYNLELTHIDLENKELEYTKIE